MGAARSSDWDISKLLWAGRNQVLQGEQKIPQCDNSYTQGRPIALHVSPVGAALFSWMNKLSTLNRHAWPSRQNSKLSKVFWSCDGQSHSDTLPIISYSKVLTAFNAIREEGLRKPCCCFYLDRVVIRSYL